MRPAAASWSSKAAAPLRDRREPRSGGRVCSARPSACVHPACPNQRHPFRSWTKFISISLFYACLFIPLPKVALGLYNKTKLKRCQRRGIRTWRGLETGVHSLGNIYRSPYQGSDPQLEAWDAKLSKTIPAFRGPQPCK